MNKKGFVLDTLTSAVLILVAVIIFFAASYFIYNLNQQVQATGTSTGMDTRIFGLATGNVPSEIDKGFMIGFMAAIGFLIYSAYSIGTNPILFGFALIINVAVMLLLPSFETLLTSTFYNNNYALVDAQLPGITFLINHYTLVFTGVAVITMIALYVRPKQSM